MMTRFVLSELNTFQAAEAGKNGLLVCLVGDGRILNARQMLFSRIFAITVIQTEIKHFIKIVQKYTYKLRRIRSNLTLFYVSFFLMILTCNRIINPDTEIDILLQTSIRSLERYNHT